MKAGNSSHLSCRTQNCHLVQQHRYPQHISHALNVNGHQGNSARYYEDEKRLIQRIKKVDRIRYAGLDRVPAEVFKAAAETGVYIARTPVLMEGSIELLQYYQQQSICNNYHRYGNLGERAPQYESE